MEEALTEKNKNAITETIENPFDSIPATFIQTDKNKKVVTSDIKKEMLELEQRIMGRLKRIERELSDRYDAERVDLDRYSMEKMGIFGKQHSSAKRLKEEEDSINKRLLNTKIEKNKKAQT